MDDAAVADRSLLLPADRDTSKAVVRRLFEVLKLVPLLLSIKEHLEEKSEVELLSRALSSALKRCSSCYPCRRCSRNDDDLTAANFVFPLDLHLDCCVMCCYVATMSLSSESTLLALQLGFVGRLMYL